MEDSAISLHRSLSKMFIMALVVLISVLVIHATPAGDLVSNVQRWKRELAGLGWWGPVYFTAAASVLVAGGFPRLMMSALAGALFGFKLSFPLAWIASVSGAYFNFLFVRWGAHDLVQRKLHIPLRVRAALNHPGYLSVILVRQMPIWGLAQNAALALTKVSHRVYLLGTLCGILPSTLISTLIGSGMGKASLEEAVRNIAWSLILMGTFGSLVWYARKRARQRQHMRDNG